MKHTGLVWTDALAIDHGAIDVQHKRLLRTINELQEAMHAGRGNKRLKKVFEELVEYVEVHFATEEQVMESCGYPLREAHRADHLRFKQVILKLEADYRQGKLGLCVEVSDFLEHWFTSHIVENDKAFWLFEHAPAS